MTPAAIERARALLLENISEEQRARLRRLASDNLDDDSLRVTGGLTGTIYQVYPRCVAIGPLCVFCIYPKGSTRGELPDPDSVLTLALYIQHDEMHFLSTTAASVSSYLTTRVLNDLIRRAAAELDHRATPGVLI